MEDGKKSTTEDPDLSDDNQTSGDETIVEFQDSSPGINSLMQEIAGLKELLKSTVQEVQAIKGDLNSKVSEAIRDKETAILPNISDANQEISHFTASAGVDSTCSVANASNAVLLTTSADNTVYAANTTTSCPTATATCSAALLSARSAAVAHSHNILSSSVCSAAVASTCSAAAVNNIAASNVRNLPASIANNCSATAIANVNRANVSSLNCINSNNMPHNTNAVLPEINYNNSLDQRNILFPDSSNNNGLSENSSPIDFNNMPVVPFNNFGTRKLLDLPHFDGQPEQWPMFYAAFVETTRVYRYTPLENLLRLQRAIKGHARTEIEALLIHPNSVEAIIKALEFRFGRRDILIKSQLAKIRSYPPVARIADIVPYSTFVTNLTTFLQNASATSHLSNPTLLEELVGKLPMLKKEEWVKHTFSLLREPSLTDFSIWLSQTSMYVSIAADLSNVNVAKGNVKDRNRSAKPIFSVSEETNRNCLLCHRDHGLYKCQAFKEKSVSQRWEYVKAQRLCFSCLQKGHSSQKCSKRKLCSFANCRKSHNSLLHDPQPTVTDSPETNIEEVVSVGIISADSLKGTLLKYLPIKVTGPKGSVEILAFIDDGAKVSLIEEGIANRIGLTGVQKPLSLKWIGDHSTTEMSRLIELEVSDRNSQDTFQLKGVRTIKKLLLPSQSLNANEIKDRYKSLARIPLASYDNVPQILIGLPHIAFTRPTQFINIDKDFTVHRTRLGWTLFGSRCGTDALVGHVDYNDDAQNELQRSLNEYFSVENYGWKVCKPLTSDKDCRAEKILTETTKFIDGHYETGLLWNKEDVILPDNFKAAYKRLLSVEAKMKDDKDLAEWYKDKINDYILKGYAKKMESTAANINQTRVWYLPHFSIVNPNKDNKRRLVFDAAAKYDSVSLNSFLLKGPQKYQPKSLVNILHNFRHRKIAVCGDIREMFHRIRIIEEDQDAQRFLWREDTSRPPNTYVMQSMIFGSICSPCSAQFVKNLNAKKFEIDEPRAVQSIVEYHYVDDFVDSFQSEEEAIHVTQAVKRIQAAANFEVRGFISNSGRVLDAINETQSNNYSCSFNESSQSEKVLGLYWNPVPDSFSFRFSFCKMPANIFNGQCRPTKRQLLSVVMSIYDPLGFIAHLTLESKVLMQRIWKLGIDWNSEIDEETDMKWRQWYKTLRLIEGLNFERLYSLRLYDSKSRVQLHFFSDASEVAYAVVCYCRIEFEDQIEVAFVAGKSRCAPMKPLSMPRLELQAAFLAARFKDAVMESIDFNVEKIVFWTDSKTVVQWIRSDCRRYKQFVGHRIAEILDATKVDQWRWVPGMQNPADDGTRIKKSPETSSRWLTGPKFLKLNEDEWPSLPKDLFKNEVSVDLKNRYVFTIMPFETMIEFTRFSNYYRLLKATCFVLKAVNKFKNKKVSLKIEAKEIEDAELLLCRLVQREAYAEELNCLQTMSPLSRKSPIYNLTPMLDKDGLLRIDGRINNARFVSECTRKPIILPQKHKFTELLVMDYHVTFHHHNHEAIAAAVRTKFWIPNLRSLVKLIRKKCQSCINSQANPQPPLMGQIPEDRLTPFIRPFTYTGLDYFGPINVSIGRRTEKRWVAIFTCMTIRAIHLELAKDLSADATVLCIRNFINRRGVPVRIRSDCGSNFIAASKQNIVEPDAVENECQKRRIEWVFNTPANPSAGGAWERMVRCVKKVLSHTVKEKSPQIETMISLLIEAENLVNSRPLTHVPVSSIEDEPLTPNHFLIGGPNFIQTPGIAEKTCVRKQWQLLQQMKQSFWKRWVTEYLPSLVRRTKWFDRVEPLKVGDVVVICDEKGARGTWQRGIVKDVFKARDGQVRSAVVRTTGGDLKRPASKLAVLDLSSESPCCKSIHGGRNVTECNESHTEV